MTELLLTSAVVIFACVVFQRLSGKFGVPGLFVFILLGMLFGSDGLFKISFDDFGFANEICSVALVFIMFYGGAGTRWDTAKPVAVKSMLLSSVGTFVTCGLVGLFCRFVLGLGWLESFLAGAVICSTDAASVFSILRNNKMNLKYQTAPVLELESGSNDPFSYMLTTVVLSLMGSGTYGVLDAVKLLVLQIVIGVLCGFAFSYIAKAVLKRYNLARSNSYIPFIVGIALASYALPIVLGGNGYLSVYITGIILGNSYIPHKKEFLSFLDGITSIMQMLLFFLLGLLSYPSKLFSVAPMALCIVLFLTFIARPIAVFAVLSPFRCKFKQQLFVSWAGMRGAASIVFAIMAMTDSAYLQYDIFHIVFFIVLFSILVQGTLLPKVAKSLDMIDENEDVMKTFNDYTSEVPVDCVSFKLVENHPWVGCKIADTVFPPSSVVVMIIRDGKKIIPNGQISFEAGDKIILCGLAGDIYSGIELSELKVSRSDRYEGKTIAESFKGKRLVIFIKRGTRVLFPSGDTVLEAGDTLIINETDYVTK